MGSCIQLRGLAAARQSLDARPSISERSERISTKSMDWCDQSDSSSDDSAVRSQVMNVCACKSFSVSLRLLMWLELLTTNRQSCAYNRMTSFEWKTLDRLDDIDMVVVLRSFFASIYRVRLKVDGNYEVRS